MGSTSKRPKLDTGGRPKGKRKGGAVTQHGFTTTGYQRGCRCDECKAAAAEAKRKTRERKAAAAQAEAAKKAERAAKAKARRAAKAAAEAAG